MSEHTTTANIDPLDTSDAGPRCRCSVTMRYAPRPYRPDREPRRCPMSLSGYAFVVACCPVHGNGEGR